MFIPFLQSYISPIQTRQKSGDDIVLNLQERMGIYDDEVSLYMGNKIHFPQAGQTRI